MNPFLTAEWRDLIVINYEVDPAILKQHVPAGTELDLWKGAAIVSLVAFRFLNTRVLGVPIPLHTNFEEVNLRFYVKRNEGTEIRRGVVFIKELVPRRAIAFVANLIYGENYCSLPMSHRIEESALSRSLSYGWTCRGLGNSVSALLRGTPEHIQSDSEAEFILEHYWGYTKRSNSRTTEYRVTHSRWRHWKDPTIDVKVDFSSTYGLIWEQALRGQRRSAFVAEGSDVAVYPGRSMDN